MPPRAGRGRAAGLSVPALPGWMDGCGPARINSLDKWHLLRMQEMSGREIHPTRAAIKAVARGRGGRLPPALRRSTPGLCTPLCGAAPRAMGPGAHWGFGSCPPEPGTDK